MAPSESLWAAQTFLIPVAGAYAAPVYTAAIQNHAPHILGVLEPGAQIVDAPPLELHPWWSPLRGITKKYFYVSRPAPPAHHSGARAATPTGPKTSD